MYIRNIYPKETFKSVSQYGIQTRENRHPDIISYITTVLGNAEPLLESSIIDSFLLATFDRHGEIVDQLSIKIKNVFARELTSIEQMISLEGEFRDALLRITMQLNLSVHDQFVQDTPWSLMVVTKKLSDLQSEVGVEGTEYFEGQRSSARVVLEKAMESGQWLVENHLLPENRQRFEL